MDHDALDSPVTLVIKAPNQKYDDQTINCFLNWTVEKLKKHISNVYPSKPSSKDQRLVYSGRLLQDHLQLRDVLRKQDEYHMVHLVCATHSPPMSPTPLGSNGTSSTTTPIGTPEGSRGFRTSDSSSSSSVASSANQDGLSASTTGSSDGLRHRGSSHSQSANPVSPGFMPLPADFQLPLQAARAIPPHPMYMPMQMMWWQHIYARHYYMQYQAALAASNAPLTTPTPAPPSALLSPTQPPQANPPPAAAAPPAPLGPHPPPPNPVAPNPAPEERPANPNIQMNAQGGAVLNDDELNRDWLDWMYTVSRAAILLSIVYFYSSFGRFVMVIGAMLLVYLHQAGWFPFRPEQNAGAGDAAQEEGDRNNDMQEMERLMDEGVEDEDGSGESGEENQDEGGANLAPPPPGFLAAAWSFISTFFTSLIPEGPPHAAN